MNDRKGLRLREGDLLLLAEAAGFTVVVARAPDGGSLCCGRTYLSAGMPERARAELARLLAKAEAEGIRPTFEA